MSSPSSSTSRATVFLWSDQKASSSRQHIDLPGLPTPPPAHTATHHTLVTAAAEPEEETEDAVDLFFGCSRPPTKAVSALQATHASLHDAYHRPTLSRASSTHRSSSPPPYTHDLELGLPSYEQSTEQTEPVVLAKYFFKFGFRTSTLFNLSFLSCSSYLFLVVFPPFWLLGSFILMSSPKAPEGWEPTKTAEERAALIAAFRKAEVRWAKRCLFALLGLLLVVAIVVAASVSIVKMTSS